MENLMNVLEIEKIIDQLVMYKNEIDKNSQDILVYLDKINDFYKSENTKDLRELSESLRNNFIKLNNSYNGEIVYLRNLMNRTIATDKYTRSLFEQNM